MSRRGRRNRKLSGSSFPLFHGWLGASITCCHEYPRPFPGFPFCWTQVVSCLRLNELEVGSLFSEGGISSAAIIKNFTGREETKVAVYPSLCPVSRSLPTLHTWQSRPVPAAATPGPEDNCFAGTLAQEEEQRSSHFTLTLKSQGNMRNYFRMA